MLAITPVRIDIAASVITMSSFRQTSLKNLTFQMCSMIFQLCGQPTTWSMSPITLTCHTRKMIVQELGARGEKWGNLLHPLIMWMQSSPPLVTGKAFITQPFSIALNASTVVDPKL